MKLWILRAKNLGNNKNPFYPAYNKATGFVVCAEHEQQARDLASRSAGEEGPLPWFNTLFTSCVEFKPDGTEAGIILRDIQVE